MFEVELKVRAAHGAIRPRLEDRAGVHLETVEQIDTYYDAPHRAFGETDEALRLREEVPAEGDRRVRLTYKGPLVEAESKTREEYETGVTDAESAGNILSELGFEPAATVEKRRERYALGDYTVTLDRVDGLGEFVEVEAEATESDRERVRDGAIELLSELGLDPAEQIRTSYLGLLCDASK